MSEEQVEVGWQFNNCTAHPIVLAFPGGGKMRLPAAENPATVHTRMVATFGGMPILGSDGKVMNLPDEKVNVVNIVSRTVRIALDEQGDKRMDCLVPAEPVYDVVKGRKQVIECRALAL